jgi:hypothetical protein
MTNPTGWTAAEVAAHRGLKTAASARSWLRRAGVPALPERRGEAKLYDPEAVRQAGEKRPGQGRRTDLKR